MTTDLAVLAVVIAGLGLLFWPRLRRSEHWRAMITPLASIIGSGFLVLGPLLNSSFGALAPVVMAALCGVAYLFGSAIRSNIATLEHRTPAQSRARMELAGSALLAFAYVISVAYYLNLFGSFAVRLTSFEGAIYARSVTTAVFMVILITGWTRGFTALERMEQVSVSLKLAIILGLLCGLAIFFAERIQTGTLVITPSELTGWPAVTLVFGLIVTVQGFETSRYLGTEFSAALRIASMRWAQWTTTAIYMVYVALLTFAVAPDPSDLSETAIIDVMGQVAGVLPYLLVGAALAAQFSAAVADTTGAGGLVAEVSRGRIPARVGYTLLVGAGVVLTWTADVFAIIAYASRAFAAYYAVECAIACWSLRGTSRLRASGYGALCLLAIAITIFGRSVE